MKKVLLCIMDGIGLRKEEKGNAYKNANTDTLDRLISIYPHTYLEASGKYVGLPEGQIGNSEVGHSTIGSGRIIYQPLEKINQSITDGSIYNDKELLLAINHAKQHNSRLHLMGLVSDGGVHSHINHLLTLLELCQKENFYKVYIHVMTDGRDTAPTSSLEYLKILKNKMAETGVGKIATVIGRYYSMDRDNRYERIKLAYDAIVNAIGPKYEYPEDAVKDNYQKGITDEFIIPSVINKVGHLEENDAIICFNFRPDRLRELYTAITNQEFTHFQTRKFNNIKLISMMPIDENIKNVNAYEPENISNVLGQVISDNNLSQIRIAETEKYPHVTYFFDGGVHLTLKKCKTISIPSPKVSTYDQLPEMSAYEITDKLLEELKEEPDLIILNYANGDMVGHTGVYDKGIIAVETVDNCINKIINNINLSKYTIIITADHGNCEQMINNDDTINTAHTTNLVPFIVVDKNIKLKDNYPGSLTDIAPTILKIMDLNIPKEMKGEVLIDE